jgi:hypothetical protein
MVLFNHMTDTTGLEIDGTHENILFFPLDRETREVFRQGLTETFCISGKTLQTKISSVFHGSIAYGFQVTTRHSYKCQD